MHPARRAHTRQEDHPQQETQQAPRRLVGNQAVRSRQRECAERQAPHKRHAPLRQQPPGRRQQGDQPTDRGQGQDHAFAPPPPVRGPGADQDSQVVIPGLQVRRFACGSTEPRQIRQDGVQRSTRIGKEGREQQPRHHPRRSDGREQMTRPKASGGGRDRFAQQTSPDRGQGHSGDRGGEGQHAGLLRRLHQPHRGPGCQCPPQFSAGPISPGGGEHGQREKHQQRFMDVIAAVEHQGGGECQHQAGRRRGGFAQSITQPPHQQHESGAKHGGHHAKRPLVGVPEVLRPTPDRRQRGNHQRRSMELVGVVRVGSRNPEAPKSGRLDRLVGMHRAIVQQRQTQG
jgi:hypothetical protein